MKSLIIVGLVLSRIRIKNVIITMVLIFDRTYDNSGSCICHDMNDNCSYMILDRTTTITTGQT